MSQLRSEIPFMASLWIRSGYDMKVEVSAETYQVGAHFKALIKAILVAPLKSFERFFRISSSPAGLCFCVSYIGITMIIRFSQVIISIQAIISEIYYVSNHWNFISNH